MAIELLENIRFVLLETTHPGNIGSAARAMKTMGLSNLVLVNPKCLPDDESRALATRGVDVLDQVRTVAHLKDAVADCHIVFGTAADDRARNWPVMTPNQAVQQLSVLNSDQKIAIIFGRESSGMSNEELDLCHAQIKIPTNKAYSSLNLSHAVQIIAYELFQFANSHELKSSALSEGMATSKDMELFYEHLLSVLSKTQFHDPENPKRLLTQLRRVFNRALLTEKEVHLLRGLLRAIQS